MLERDTGHRLPVILTPGPGLKRPPRSSRCHALATRWRLGSTFNCYGVASSSVIERDRWENDMPAYGIGTLCRGLKGLACSLNAGATTAPRISFFVLK